MCRSQEAEATEEVVKVEGMGAIEVVEEAGLVGEGVVVEGEAEAVVLIFRA